MQVKRSWRFGVAAISCLALLVGCGQASEPSGDEGGEAPGNRYVEGMVPQSDGGKPQEGGTITVAGNVEPRSLDPAVTLATGATGGTEMSNIYDTLARYDSASKAVVPQLAESITANDDSSVFTITLRDGVEFSDGTALDAEAVKWSMERYGASPTAPEGVMWNGNVQEVQVVDNRTVEVVLQRSFPAFVNMLGTGPGMIVGKGSGEGENFTPVGAGPFTLKEMKPSEHVELVANDGYWAGAPKLDGVRFVYLNDQETSLETQAAGNAQVVLLSTPAVVERMLIDEGRSGYLDLTSSGAASLINASPGRPGNDPRVRKALALSLDPQVMVDRGYDGVGEGTNRLFGKDSRWYDASVEANAYDIEEAKRLLEEAKADGYDGKLTYVSSPDQAARDAALSLKAQWEVVGFEVEVEAVRTTADLVTRGMNEDYDLMRWSIGIRDQDPYQKFLPRMHSTGNQTYGTYTSPEMDSLIDKFRDATTQEEAQAAVTKIEEQFQEDVPIITHIATWEYLQWEDTLRDVTGGSQVMVMFDKAYLTS